MKYYEALDLNKDKMIENIEHALKEQKVQMLGFSECIVMKENVEAFVKELSALGILIEAVHWWCYVNPKEADANGCPHGLGGPCSTYYDGWFSELQNEGYIADKISIDRILESYNMKLIDSTNKKTLNELKKMLKKPFTYSPTYYIEGNRCVNPALLLLLPDKWKRNRTESGM